MLVEDISRNKRFSRIRISHVLRFISICELFTVSLLLSAITHWDPPHGNGFWCRTVWCGETVFGCSSVRNSVRPPTILTDDFCDIHLSGGQMWGKYYEIGSDHFLRHLYRFNSYDLFPISSTLFNLCSWYSVGNKLRFYQWAVKKIHTPLKTVTASTSYCKRSNIITCVDVTSIQTTVKRAHSCMKS
jgi:hypothetical protein